MKITCEYCGNTFNDTEAQCPFCGSPNKGVVRSAQNQPKTIGELQEWYRSKGLPPAETTRFFIGVDYKGARAFGIFKDETSGVCTVYKNKDNGERAVRYQGTDEAYAVNELYQRLKQEIIQQKMNQAKKGGSSASAPIQGANFLSSMFKGVGALAGIVVAGFIGLMLIIIIIGGLIGIVENEPEEGYYSYNQNTYYYSYTNYGEEKMNWFMYDNTQGEWTGPIARDGISEDMSKNSHAKDFFLSKDWEENFKCTDFADSVYAKDIQTGLHVGDGYYKYDDDVYYHLDNSYDAGWYKYDEDDWTYVESSSLPIEMTHTSQLEDFYYTPEWDSSTQITDFESTEIYQDEIESRNSSWDDDDDSDFSWDSSDSWDSGSTDWGSDW